MKRVGILTSGGDCQALNAAMRGVVAGLSNNIGELEIYGFLNGYKGLIYGDFRMLTSEDFSHALNEGGTILGSSRMPFKKMREPDKDGLDKVEAMKQNYYRLRLDVLVILGGNGSLKSADMLSEEGLNIIHLPKTIDNDICGTDMTFGFYSAVNVAVEAIDRIRTTAKSHGRVFVVELMGHKTGWLALYAGIAGGADVILIPEIPYDTEKIAETIKCREKAGKEYTIIAMAEGAVSKEDSLLPDGQYRKKKEKRNGVPSAFEFAEKLKTAADTSVYVCVPGHTQRGGSPCPYDRVLASRIGAKCAEMIMNEEYGYMAGLVNGRIEKIPLKEAAGRQKRISPDDSVISEAAILGISFGV